MVSGHVQRQQSHRLPSPDARMPARAAVQMAFGAPRDLAAPQFPADQLVRPQPIAFSATDGMKIRAQLFLPASGGTENAPPSSFSMVVRARCSSAGTTAITITMPMR